MINYFFVGIGGFIGAGLRYFIINVTGKLIGTNFPYGTLLVNVLGCFLIGIIMELSLSSNYVSPNLKIFLTTGILGGLTTFSTFSYETAQFVLKSNLYLSIINIILNVFVCLLSVLIGQYLVRQII